MAKWKSWFGWVGRLFTRESKEKKPKKWGWSLGRLKLKQCHTLTAPNRTTLSEAKEEQKKKALTVAIATAAAAEAAVAAAHAAAEVVRLTGASRSYSYLSKGDRNLAAIKIQSVYRGHLARKALRALKGVVRLQAIVRGQAVRRQVFNTLNHLPLSAREQVEIHERNIHIADESFRNEMSNQFPKLKKKLEEGDIKPECHTQRTWDCSVHSKEDIEAIWLRKQEATLKRERMKQYSFSHRERKNFHLVEEYSPQKEYGRESGRTLGQWLHEEACRRNVLELYGSTQVAQKNVKKEDSQEALNSQISLPRKSFSRVKKGSAGDDSSMPNSPVFPTYMAVTESAKAKVRSSSTPRQRTEFLELRSSQSEPQKENISFWSSHCSAPTSTNANTEVSRQRLHCTNHQSEPQKENISFWSSHCGAPTSTNANTVVSRQRFHCTNHHHHHQNVLNI